MSEESESYIRVTCERDDFYEVAVAGDILTVDVCGRCKALVPHRQFEAHVTWHVKAENAYDWACGCGADNHINSTVCRSCLRNRSEGGLSS